MSFVEVNFSRGGGIETVENKREENEAIFFQVVECVSPKSSALESSCCRDHKEMWKRSRAGQGEVRAK